MVIRCLCILCWMGVGHQFWSLTGTEAGRVTLLPIMAGGGTGIGIHRVYINDFIL